LRQKPGRRRTAALRPPAGRDSAPTYVNRSV